MNWYKQAKLITIEELTKNLPEHSFVQCVECNRWFDMCNEKNGWKTEKEMTDAELKALNQEKEAIAKGRGRTFSTCGKCRLASKPKKDKEPLTPEERKQVKKRFGDDLECSFAKDKDGYYCYTHRARSDSYPFISKIPKSAYEFICSTG